MFDVFCNELLKNPNVWFRCVSKLSQKDIEDINFVVRAGKQVYIYCIEEDLFLLHSTSEWWNLVGSDSWYQYNDGKWVKMGE